MYDDSVLYKISVCEMILKHNKITVALYLAGPARSWPNLCSMLAKSNDFEYDFYPKYLYKNK